MKKLLVLFLVLNCAFIYSQSDSLRKKWIEELNEKFEKNCKKDSAKASIDSKIKTLYYINVPTPNGEDFLPSNELTEILKPYGIKFGGTWMGSDIAGYYTDSLCYKSTMARIAKDKFGEKFFEEKKQEALEVFIKNNPDRIFDYRRESVQFSENNFEIDFWEKSKLPKNYIKKRDGENFSKVYASFTTNQSGKAENIELETDFKNEDNVKLEKQILLLIKKQILNHKWKPNKYKGFPVKSLQFISITIP